MAGQGPRAIGPKDGLLHAHQYAQLHTSGAAGDGLAEQPFPAGRPAGEQWPAMRLARCAVPLALIIGFVAATATAAWLSGSSQRLRKPLVGELVLKADASEPTWEAEYATLCGETEIDMDYVDDSPDAWGTNYDHIPSPEMCCAMCQGNPKCQAFTWVKDAGLEGCKSQCWIKSAVGTKKHKKGVVSGVPPPRPALPAVPSGVGGPGGTLYCFSLVVPAHYEPGMLLWQHAHKASIFACDGQDVYSSKEFMIAPGVKTLVVDSDLKCEYGGDSGTALNAWIFIAVFKKVIDYGAYKNYDWVVKVDADAVFFPDRLGKLLTGHEKKGYINNCKYGMHGPIEVFSSDAISILGADYEANFNHKAPKKCITKLNFGLWGEDMFLDQCLGRVLEVKPRPLEPKLMCEAHCDCPAWYWCQNGTDRVSYHPFKSPEAYEVCMANALGGKPGPSRPKPAELLTFTPQVGDGAKDSAKEALPDTSTDEPSTTASASEDSAADAADGDCVDAVTDDEGRAVDGQAKCAKQLLWAKRTGIYEHPEWYEDEGLTGHSPYSAFQRWLFKHNLGSCRKPCTTEGRGKGHTAPAATEADSEDDSSAEAPQKQYKPGPRAQTFYMYRAQSAASYPMENINTADLAGVMWYLHNEVVSNTPRKYHIDRIRRFKVTVKNTWEFWNVHKRQFGAFMAYDAARCSTPVCPKVYAQYGFIVGCQVCDVKVANYLAKGQTNWNCKKGDDRCRAPLWYSLPGPCPAMGMSNEEINPNKVGLNVMKSKSEECLRRMPGGHCVKASGDPDCTYSYEEAGEVMLDELVGIRDYNYFWNESYTECVIRRDAGTKCIHNKEYVAYLDKGVGCSFWDGIHDAEKCTDRMNAVRHLFKKKFPHFPESLEEPPCEFDMYYEGEFTWPRNHTGAAPSDYWDTQM